MSAAVMDPVSVQAAEHAEVARIQARSLFQSQREARAALGRVDFERILERFLQDVMTEATASHWDRRAATFQAVGNARCDATALECRRQAWLLRHLDQDDTAGIPEVLR